MIDEKYYSFWTVALLTLIALGFSFNFGLIMLYIKLNDILKVLKQLVK